MQPHHAETMNPEPAGGRARPFDALMFPEQLIVSGYRCWMTGYTTGDIACWEVAWNVYAHSLGPEQARPAVTALATWVRTLRRRTARPLDRLPFGCSRLCPDEVTGLRLVAACQRRSGRLARAAAFELTAQQSSSLIDEVVTAAGGFADALLHCGQEIAQKDETLSRMT